MDKEDDASDRDDADSDGAALAAAARKDSDEEDDSRDEDDDSERGDTRKDTLLDILDDFDDRLLAPQQASPRKYRGKVPNAPLCEPTSRPR